MTRIICTLLVHNAPLGAEYHCGRNNVMARAHRTLALCDYD
jgi:hypothetical protein